MLNLETPRLLLRPFADADLEAFLAYRSDPEVARYQSWETPYPRAVAEEFVRRMKNMTVLLPGKWLQLVVERLGQPGVVGDVTLHLLDRHQAEIGFTLARAFQGNGYASEAVVRLLDYVFDEMQLHRVSATCDAANLASVRLLERVGMRREGHFLDHSWFKGAWCSEYLYAILRREWIARRPLQ